MRAMAGGTGRPLPAEQGMSPRDRSLMAGLALDLFQGLGMGDPCCVNVALDTSQEAVHRPLERCLIHEEGDLASSGPRLAEFRIAMAGEAVFRRREGLRSEGYTYPSEKDYCEREQAAARAPPPFRFHTVTLYYFTWHFLQSAGVFTLKAFAPLWQVPQNFPWLMAAIVIGPDLPRFIWNTLV